MVCNRFMLAKANLVPRPQLQCFTRKVGGLQAKGYQNSEQSLCQRSRVKWYHCDPFVWFKSRLVLWSPLPEILSNGWPGPPTSLVQFVNLGVAWDEAMQKSPNLVCTCTCMYSRKRNVLQCNLNYPDPLVHDAHMGIADMWNSLDSQSTYFFPPVS